jgi:hypothetical protein
MDGVRFLSDPLSTRRSVLAHWTKPMRVGYKGLPPDVVDSGGIVLADWCNGSAPALQAGRQGSIP